MENPLIDPFKYAIVNFVMVFVTLFILIAAITAINGVLS